MNARESEPLRMTPRMLNLATAADYCAISRQTLYELMADPLAKFPTPVRYPREDGRASRPRFDVRDLDAWIDAQKASAERERSEAAEVARAVLERPAIPRLRRAM